MAGLVSMKMLHQLAGIQREPTSILTEALLILKLVGHLGGTKKYHSCVVNYKESLQFCSETRSIPVTRIQVDYHINRLPVHAITLKKSQTTLVFSNF